MKRRFSGRRKLLDRNLSGLLQKYSITSLVLLRLAESTAGSCFETSVYYSNEKYFDRRTVKFHFKMNNSNKHLQTLGVFSIAAHV